MAPLTIIPNSSVVALSNDGNNTTLSAYYKGNQKLYVNIVSPNISNTSFKNLDGSEHANLYITSEDSYILLSNVGTTIYSTLFTKLGGTVNKQSYISGNPDGADSFTYYTSALVNNTGDSTFMICGTMSSDGESFLSITTPTTVNYNNFAISIDNNFINFLSDNLLLYSITNVLSFITVKTGDNNYSLYVTLIDSNSVQRSYVFDVVDYGTESETWSLLAKSG
jgi:hypothetical protein